MILNRPESRPGLVGEKLTLYIGVWLYYATFSRAPGAKARTRNRRLQNFIVCHAEINNKTDFSYDLYNIFLPQGSRILVMSRSSIMCVCVYKWACMYMSYARIFIKFILLSSYIMRVCIFVFTLYSRALLLFFFIIFRFLSASFSMSRVIFAQNSPPYIQYVKIYRLSYSRKYS